MKGATQPVQNVGTVAFATSVKKRVERRIGDAGQLLKFVACPAFAFENFLQLADDHLDTID